MVFSVQKDTLVVVVIFFFFLKKTFQGGLLRISLHLSAPVKFAVLTETINNEDWSTKMSSFAYLEF